MVLEYNTYRFIPARLPRYTSISLQSLKFTQNLILYHIKVSLQWLISICVKPADIGYIYNMCYKADLVFNSFKTTGKLHRNSFMTSTIPKINLTNKITHCKRSWRKKKMQKAILKNLYTLDSNNWCFVRAYLELLGW